MYFQAKKYAWSENASKISYKLMHWNTTEIPIKKKRGYNAPQDLFFKERSSPFLSTLESVIDVGHGINVGPGKFV